MTEWTFSVKGDWYEDREVMQDLMRVNAMSAAIHNALDQIRTRLKYGDGVTDAEEKNLEEIRNILQSIDVVD